jgi:hypothetical protein
MFNVVAPVMLMGIILYNSYVENNLDYIDEKPLTVDDEKDNVLNQEWYSYIELVKKMFSIRIPEMYELEVHCDENYGNLYELTYNLEGEVMYCVIAKKNEKYFYEISSGICLTEDISGMLADGYEEVKVMFVAKISNNLKVNFVDEQMSEYLIEDEWRKFSISPESHQKIRELFRYVSDGDIYETDYVEKDWNVIGK